MLETVFIKTSSGQYPIEWQQHGHKAILDLASRKGSHRFDLVLAFKTAITHFRNHDYTWVSCDVERIAGEYCPKIIKVGGRFIQPTVQTGIWQTNPRKPNELLWRFNPEHAAPLAVYSGAANEKKVVSANQHFDFKTLALLFSEANAIEFSRSKTPFTAIACFTDHCDYDTAANLKIQRELFKSHGIVTTKGFFLHDFSKRENASFDNESAELTEWRNDGHELAYHSLSQSVKPKPQPIEDFKNFEAPFPDLHTWIDHGFQPYNLSTFQSSGMSAESFEGKLKQQNIRLLWNYIDCGTSAQGVINQLNSSDFTLARFASGNHDLGFTEKIGVMIKNIMFHFYADEKIILRYKNTASNFKKVVYQKSVKSLFRLMADVAGLSAPMAKVLLGWASVKNQPYKLAKYQPLFFKHQIANQTFCIFQTIEMVDFKTSLSRQNIDKLMAEKGLFIAHTYFAVPFTYHNGRMFATADTIDPTVSANFALLGDKIKNREIWNPTLVELYQFLANFEHAVLDADASGNIIVSQASGLPYRTVN